MPTSQTTIRLDRPSRYLVQFCKHATGMGRAGTGHQPRVHGSHTVPAADGVTISVQQQTDEHALVDIDPLGQITLHAESDTLTVTLQAADDEALRRLQDIVTRDLQRFGRRDHLQITWPDSPPASDHTTNSEGSPSNHAPRIRPGRAALIGGIALVAVLVAAHAIFGAALLDNLGWIGGSVAAIAVIIGTKLVLIMAGGRRLHKRLRRG